MLKGLTWSEKFWFYWKVFSTSCSFGHAKRSFDKPVEVFFAKIRVFCCSDSKKVEQDCFSGKLYLFKMIPGQEKCIFRDSAGKKPLKSSYFPKFGIDQKIYKFFNKNCFYPTVPENTDNALLRQLSLSLFLRMKPSFSQSPKRWTNLFIFQKNRFSSKCLRDTRNANLTTMLEWIR